MVRIQKLSQLANLKNFSSFFNAKTITDHVVDSLAKEGQRIIREAYLKRNWKNRTYNLYNSYVAAVIVSGTVRKVMFLGPERKPSKRPNDNYDRPYYAPDRTQKGGIDVGGRDEALNFVMSYAAQHKQKKVTLVVGAAMFYAGILESNGYHVLAGIDESMKEIKAKGLILTDYKVGNMFSGFKDGSNAQLMIGSKHIAYRKDQEVEKASDRKKTFNTKVE